MFCLHYINTPARNVPCMWCNPLCPLSFSASEGSNLTPAHHYGDFRFKTYAPIAFRYFREMFGIRPDDYMVFLFTQHYTQKMCKSSEERERAVNCEKRGVIEELKRVKLRKC